MRNDAYARRYPCSGICVGVTTSRTWWGTSRVGWRRRRSGCSRRARESGACRDWLLPVTILLMKIVHFADLHLDAPFAWAGAFGAAARRRRQALRDVLVRIVDLTRKVQAEALFCGGDLYEHEHCTPDTAEFLRTTFAELAPVPVYLAPGNHDWYGPASLYALVEWSHNVFVFRESRLRPVKLCDGVTLWGAAHLGPANTGNFLNGFHTERAGMHVALFHGSERSWFTEQSAGKQPHAPFLLRRLVRQASTTRSLATITARRTASDIPIPEIPNRSSSAKIANAEP